MKNKQELLVQCFKDVSDDARVQNKWISMQTWESMIRERFNFGDHYDFRQIDLSKAIQHSIINPINKISRWYHDDDDNGNATGRKTNVHFFLVVYPKQKPSAKGPPKDDAKSYWESHSLKEQNCILER
jgi:hypothetical protein